jgi:hypothetical protein
MSSRFSVTILVNWFCLALFPWKRHMVATPTHTLSSFVCQHPLDYSNLNKYFLNIISYLDTKRHNSRFYFFKGG